MATQAQIIFAISSDCPGLRFGQWLSGEEQTWLLVLEDTAPPPEIPKPVFPAGIWSYRLHASGTVNHSKQRHFVQEFCQGTAHELDSFSHVKRGIHKLLLDLGEGSGNAQASEQTIKFIVEGGSKEAILKLADLYAAYLTLEKLLGKIPIGQEAAYEDLNYALSNCPACGAFFPLLQVDPLPNLQKVAAWCVQ